MKPFFEFSNRLKQSAISRISKLKSAKTTDLSLNETKKTNLKSWIENAFAKIKKPNLSFSLGAPSSIRTLFSEKLKDLAKTDPREVLDRLKNLGSGKAFGLYVRLSAAAFAAYFTADTLSLFTEQLIPEPPIVPAPRVARQKQVQHSIEEYGAIIGRNLFNSQGLIPEEEGVMSMSTARKTNLPFALIGTLVTKDELKSIATLEDRSSNMTFPVRIKDNVANKIEIQQIEKYRVYFKNLSTGFLEYVELQEEMMSLNTKVIRPSSAKTSSHGVTQQDESHYTIDRTSIEKSLLNLGEVLQQARAVPNYENGMIDGYRINQIVNGSIYEQLGIKNGDVITGLNGDPLNDPAKAFQMFNELKNTNHVEITVKRNGIKQSMVYDIK